MNAAKASFFDMVKGMTFDGASAPESLPPNITGEPQKLHVVAVVSLSVRSIAPQLLHWYWFTSSPSNVEEWKCYSNSLKSSVL